MKSVDLPLRTVLVEPFEETSHVYFIESGLASVTADSPDGEVIEIGHIGHEGMAGINIALMTKRVPSKTLMQIAGAGIAIPSGEFSEIIEESFEARRLLLAMRRPTKSSLLTLLSLTPVIRCRSDWRVGC
jgi:CRP-like cAMP-binding protein